MSRQPHHTPVQRRSRPDVLDDERAPETPRKPPPSDDAEAAAELGRAALEEFLSSGGAHFGIGVAATWDHRLTIVEDGTRALARAQLHHEEAAKLREQAARERHEVLAAQMTAVLTLLAQQGTAIGSTGAALATTRASLPDTHGGGVAGGAPPGGGGALGPSQPAARSTFPAALRAAVQSKTAAGVLIGFVLAVLAFAEQAGWLQP